MRQYWKYGSASPTVYALTLHEASGLQIPTPGLVRGGIRINGLGFRGPEIAMPKPDGTVRLAFLGASTTYCAEVSSNEVAWPHLVTEMLRSRYPETRFDYVNAGVPGYTTAENIKNLEFRVAPLEPDVIVIYEATNDLSMDTRRLAQREGLLSENPDRTSALGRWSTLWFLLEKNWKVWRRQGAARTGDSRLQFDPQALSRDFELRLDSLVERAQRQARLVVLVTFSHRVRHDQSDEEKLNASVTSLYYMPYMSVEGLLAGFDEYNRVIREIARTRGALLVAGEDEIPGDARHFVDSVHFTDRGSRQMAERVVRVLLSENAVPNLGGSPVSMTNE